MLIDVSLLSFWRSGTGAGAYGSLDAVCAVDHNGLPYLPGRHLKGLLREAVRKAEAFGWFGDDQAPVSNWSQFLFGEPGFVSDNSEVGVIVRHNAITTPGVLRVDSAHILAPESGAILANPELVPHLFQVLRTTAMDKRTGAAKHKSLREEQVAVPLSLEFKINLIDSAVYPENAKPWTEILEAALPLIRAVGQKRTRGLGRARLKNKVECT